MAISEHWLRVLAATIAGILVCAIQGEFLTWPIDIHVIPIAVNIFYHPHESQLMLLVPRLAASSVD